MNLKNGVASAVENVIKTDGKLTAGAIAKSIVATVP